MKKSHAVGSDSRAHKIARGAFINTGKANCSIFESGTMVYNCIKNSQYYSLDYFCIDEIDLDALVSRGCVKPDGAGESAAGSGYDFWVFNWHFVTMAFHIDLPSIGKVSGTKFCILLEVEPENPLRHVAVDVFDGYIALDPTTPAIGKIVPFPRPLPGAALQPRASTRDVPVISSFGFGTPGKGFPFLVEAVNREFDRAVVRINVPPGTYTSGCDGIHRTYYPDYLASLCRGVAKPGIEVRFTHDFMSPGELLDWCTESDLNCFLYTRRQAGLSATTDQCILSGRPLLTGTNDTFRHIHKLIPPYPVIGLRQAMKTTVPAVRRLQQSWSSSAFANTFERMLASFGLVSLAADDRATMAQGAVQQVPLLVLSLKHRCGTGIVSYETRLSDCLRRSGVYDVRLVESADLAAFVEENPHYRPAGVVVTGYDGETRALAQALAFVSGPKILLRDGEPRGGREENGIVILPRRPIIPYYTAGGQWPACPRIRLLGFTAPGSNLGAILEKIGRDLTEAEVIVDAPEAERARMEARITGPNRPWASPSLRVSVQTQIDEPELFINGLIASDSAVVCYYDECRSREVENFVCLAMATERAVVFTHAAPYPEFRDVATYVEDLSVADILSKGSAAHIKLYAEFGEWQAFAEINRHLMQRIQVWAATGTLEGLPELSGDAFVDTAYRAVLGRMPDREGLDDYLDRLNDGMSKEELVGSLLLSPEGLAYQTNVHGPTAGLEGLPALEGEDFVDTAYRAILGRRPDPEGLDHQLSRLNDGTAKAALAGGLFLSPEGMSFHTHSHAAVVGSNGLPELAGASFVDAAFRWILGRAPNPDELAFHLARLGGGDSKVDLVGGLFLSREGELRRATVHGSSVGADNLAIREGSDFVEAVYRAVLGRGSDPVGHVYYLNRLTSGTSKEEVAGHLFLSSEGLAYQATTHGPVPSAAGLLMLDREALPASPSAAVATAPIAPTERATSTAATVPWLSLLQREGADFVHGVHWRVLRRSPSVDEFDTMLGRLHGATTKAEILGELLLSPEHLGQPSTMSPVLLGLVGLGAQEGLAFINAAHWIILGRGPAPAERAHFLGHLDGGGAKTTIMGELVLSREGIARLAACAGEAPVAAPEPCAVEPMTTAETVLRGAEPRPTTLVEVVPGRTVFLMVGAATSQPERPSAFVLRLAEAFLELGVMVRFVHWDLGIRKFRLLPLELLGDLRWTESYARHLAVHPVRSEADVVLDLPRFGAHDWLLVTDPLRRQPDLDRLYELDVIIEARRLKLRSAFIFHGAEALRRRGIAAEEAAAHELYMQALLLADAILPEATLPERDLLGFFFQHQKAAFTPLIRQVRPPASDGRDGWRPGILAYARRVGEVMTEAEASLHALSSLYYCVGTNQSATATIPLFVESLARALVGCGVALLPAVWNSESKRLVAAERREGWGRGEWIGWTDWIEPSQPSGPSWILCPTKLPREALEDMVAIAKAHGLRVATILHAAPDRTDDQFAGIVDCDKVLAVSEPVFDQFHRLLLSSLNKTPCAEHRFRVVPLPNETPWPSQRGAPMPPANGVFHVVAVNVAGRRGSLEALVAAAEGAARRFGIHMTLTVTGAAPSAQPPLPNVRNSSSLDIQWCLETDSVTHSRLAEAADLLIWGTPDRFAAPVAECVSRGAPCLMHSASRACVKAEIPGVVQVDFGDAEAFTKALVDLMDQGRRCCLAEEALGQPVRRWNEYARDVAIELAADRPVDSVHRLETKPGRDIYSTLANLSRRPKLSLCISTYQRAGWVAINLKNIFQQIASPRADLEILVVDNASPDDTPDAVAPYLDRPDFRYVRNPYNVGMLGNLAVTAQRARGEYIWIIGDDDLTRSGAIERVLELLHGRPELALIYLNYGYSSEGDPKSITDLHAFLNEYNVLQPTVPDDFGKVKVLAAKTENFFTAIYSHVYRRDHALRSYCQVTSGRIFSTMQSCVPTAYYVLNFMGDEPAYWLGEPALVVNSNVSWAAYGAMLDLEHLPHCWDLAERIGCDPVEVDGRRSNRLWLVEMMWRQIFEDDGVGNSAYFSAARVLMRLKHLSELRSYAPQFREVYERARAQGHPAARMPADVLFAAFDA